MRITLAEELAGGTGANERSFEKETVLVGRDAFECDVAFDKDVYPMVSRRHAEIRRQNGNWYVVDLNSSYGTFLNDQQLTTAMPLAVGSSIRIGQSGPVLRVTWIESAHVPREAVVPQAVAYATDAASAAPKAAAFTPRQDPVVQHSRTSSARLIFVSEDARRPVELSDIGLWLGRDPSCQIIFEASAIMVSRRHAQIRPENSSYVIDDNNSFNGTLVNGQRISAVTPLYHGDDVQLGLGGPIIRFDSPGRSAPAGASMPGQRSIEIDQIVSQLSVAPASSKTMVFNLERGAPGKGDGDQPQLLMSLSFGGKKELSIGRGETNDIKLDGLQISTRHARLVRSGSETVIDDLGSTNGVYVNGARVSRQTLTDADALQIGSFIIRVDNAGNVGVFDTRSKTRIDAVNLCREVKSKYGSGRITLLDSISLSIQPNEFVGLLGPSGSGKSTLIDALNGVRPARGGNVLINNLDLYRHFDSLKQSIGYVPQDDVIHRELTVYKTLYYTARLRLSRDVSRAEINQTINEILDVTGLAERRNVPVNQLSGGQRKRVSIAVELITKPSVIFLDEPTSGLDPATEEKIMKLFRQIAESGRTVIMTTHAMENVRLFDKVVLLMRGKLAFYGTPAEALKYFEVKTFKELYDKLDEPVEREVAQHGEVNRMQITEHVANEWKQRFVQTPQYRSNINDPLSAIGSLEHARVYKKRRLGLFGAIRQWLTLSRRYVEVLGKDKLNLFILLIQAPVIAALTFFVMGSDLPRDFVYFVLSLVAIWFGTSVAAREIIRERPVFRRERMVNLGILPYLASKLLVIGLIVTFQCLLLFIPLKILDLLNVMAMPGELFGLPQLWAMLLTAGVGVALGLFVSALVRTSEMATSLVPLILIPQILFSGLVGVPYGLNKVIALTMPAAWSFDTMKRFSTLDTLEPEGAEPNGSTQGRGLYKYTKEENEKIVTNARKSIEDYKKDAETKFREYDRQVRNGETPALPHPDEPQAIPDPKQVPTDLSHYVTFLNPWMNEVLNQIVLMVMFGLLVITTLIILKLQDVG
jgi:ABC-type multidrug transport system ATPase subunit/pSer/pThr/pTyr-binding forkhead associated (FHA) protein